MGVFKSFVKLLSASAGGQLFLFSIIPIVTRIYDAEELGYFANAFAITSIVSIGASGRYELSLPIVKTPHHAKLLLTICSSTLFLSAFLLAFAVATFLLLSDHGLSSNVSLIYCVMPLSVYAIGLFRLHNFFAIREQAYTSIALNKFRQNIVNGVSQITLGALGFSSPGLLLSHTIAQLTCVMFYKSQLNIDRIILSSYRKKKAAVLFKRYVKFPLYDMPAAFIDNANVQMPNLVFAWLFSPAQAGIYMLAERVILTPVSMIAQSASQVYLGHVSRNEKLFTISVILFVVMAILGGAMLTLVNLIPEVFYTFLLGEEWSGIHVYVNWLALTAAIQLVYSPISMLFVVTEAQNYNFITQFSLLGCKIIAIVYAYSESSLLLAVKWLSISSFAVYSIAVCYLLLRSFGYNMKKIK